jgi:hypothetical protein
MRRSMAVPEAKFAGPALVTLYRQESGPRVKDGLAVAIVASGHRFGLLLGRGRRRIRVGQVE